MMFLAFSHMDIYVKISPLVENKTDGICKNCSETTLDEKLLKTPGNNSAAFKQLVNIY